MSFKNYNPNPLNNKTGDCVVRALCKATEKDWDTVYKELFELGFEMKVMPNSDECWKKYLELNGFKKHSLKITKGSKRPRVKEFNKISNKGSYILNVANHIIAHVDEDYYDSWDSGDCCLYGYYEKE